MKELSTYMRFYSSNFDVKFQNFFECPQGNANNYSINDLDHMLNYKHYLNGWVFLFVTVM